MKSLKKRGKRLLTDIKESAERIALISSDLDLLKDLHQMANEIAEHIDNLSRELSGLSKAEFAETLANAESLPALEEIVDIDAISLLEEKLFAAQADLENSEIGVFLQQLLEKVEKLHTPMLEAIQQLTALPEED